MSRRPEISCMAAGWRAVLVLVLLLGALPASAQPSPATTARPSASGEAPIRPTVLVIMPLQPGHPLFDTIARGIMDEFLRASPSPSVSLEYLYDWLDPPEVNERQKQFLRAKYARRRVDVVIAIGHPAYATIREDIGLPASVPLVFLEGAIPLPDVANSARVVARESVTRSYELLRGLRPGPHPVALIGGASLSDRMNNGATLAQLRTLLPPERVYDLTGLEVEELRRRIAALPADAFVLLGTVLADQRGRPLTHSALLTAIAPVARHPVVVSTDLVIDEGVLGGLVFDVEAVGARVAQLAQQILDGAVACDLQTVALSPTPVVDARQMERFRFDEARLPAGTDVRHRPLRLWDSYRTWILAGATVLLLQSALIGWLLSERRRRLRSQEELAQRLGMQALVAEVSSAFAETSADQVEAQMLRSIEEVGAVLRASDCSLWAWQAPGTQPRLICRWLTEPGALPVPTVFDQVLLEWARPRLEQGQEVHVSDISRIAAPAPTHVGSHVVSMLLLPLRVDGRVVGVLTLSHPHSQAWTQQVIGDLRTIGGIVATAVVRARAAASSRAQLETLAHVDRVAGLGQAAASIAHELSQPLAAILSNTEVAHQLLGLPDPPLDEVREILADVIADDERAGGIIRNMRTTLRKHRVEAMPVHVNVVVAEIRRLVAHDPRMRRASVEVDLGQDLPLVHIDETQLKQVLLNLVVNAVDAMADLPLRRPVLLRTTPSDGGVLVEVHDSGPGIPGEILPRLFDPFFTTKADGLGVGLAISRSILESVGGRITAANAAEGGAVFRVWLPGLPATPAVDVPARESA